MNCKPGDLAVFVRSMAGNEGKIVRCIRLATEDELSRTGFNQKDGPVWVVDQAMNCTSPGVRLPLGKDRNLRPIRPQPDDAVDETLLWLPVPSEKTKELA